jgi:large subunit ribosomal protein L17
MRHLSDKIHLGRTREHRYAMLSNMTASLVMHKKIVTTLAKAKYARRFAERMITFARKGDLSARRRYGA